MKVAGSWHNVTAGVFPKAEFCFSFNLRLDIFYDSAWVFILNGEFEKINCIHESVTKNLRKLS